MYGCVMFGEYCASAWILWSGCCNLCFVFVVLQLRFRRYLACARNKLWWMTPEWGTSLNVLPQETQFLLLELEDAVSYAVVLPLIDGDFRGTLRPNR